ncbi:MAG: FkbM family methyltransferase, partial [Candidatus Nanohaloarchaea archaeon]
DRVLDGYLRVRDISPADTVIDVGAYPGEFSIYAAKQGAEVYALEPDPDRRADLHQNLEINDFTGTVQVLDAALSSDESPRSTTLDRLMQTERIDSLDFVKMDIEGAEIDAVRGGVETLQSYAPFLAIASYHEVDGEKTCYELERLFQDREWNVETRYRRHLTTYAWNDDA